MHALQFSVGEDRYAIDALAVIEVVPAIPLRSVAGAPEAMAGLLSYRGAVLPVVDLCRLLGDGPCPQRMGSRIAVCGLDPTRRIGVLAEHVTRLIEVDPEGDAAVPGPETPGIPALGRLVRVADGLVQLVRVEDLVPDALYDQLTRGNPAQAERSAEPSS